MPKRSRSGVVRRPGARGGADQRELRQLDLDRTRRRPLADDQVELEILHRRIEDFLDRGAEPMDLVDEQDVALLQIGQERREVAGLDNHRPRGGAEADAELARQDLRQRGLAEAGRTDEQHMVQRLAAFSRRLDENRQIGPRRAWPTNSASRCGRSAVSPTSSARRSGVTMRGAVLTSPIPSARAGSTARSRRAHRRSATPTRSPRPPAAGRSQD